MSTATPPSSPFSSSLEESDGRSPGRKGRFRTSNKSSPQKPTEMEQRNFFDFTVEDEEESEEKWESPAELLKKRRQRASKTESSEAVPYAPDENVETIGGAYVDVDRLSSAMKKGRTASGKCHIPESPSFRPTHSDVSASLPSNVGRTEKGLRTAITAGTKDIIVRDDKIMQLERQIEDLRAMRWKPPGIPDTINRILMGQSFCLDWYKSMEEKRALLDAAVATCDGNCIMTILLFIRRTLDHGLLMGMLVKRPIAAQHYACFLKQLQAWNELASLYRILEDFDSLGYLRLQQCETVDTPGPRAQQLKKCHIIFKNNPPLQSEAHYVDEYARLTEKQKLIEESDGHGGARFRRAGNVIFQPLTTTLLYCCRYHKNEPENRTGSPDALGIAFNISEKQFFQVRLLSLCLGRDWEGVDTLLTSKGVVFGFGKKKKSPIGFERVVKTLANRKNRAPDDVISKYLMEVDDIELRFELATQAQIFDIGIEALKQMKDRERLSSYVNHIPLHRQKEYRDKIKTLVSNTQIRWKT